MATDQEQDLTYWKDLAELREQELNALREEYAEFQETSQDYESAMEKELQQAQGQVKKYETKLDQVTRDLEETRHKLLKSSEVDQLKISKLESVLSEAIAQTKVTKQQVVSLETDNEKLEQQLRISENLMADLEYKLDTSLEELALIQGELDESKNHYQEQADRLRQQLSDMQNEVTVLKAKDSNPGSLLTSSEAPLKAPHSSTLYHHHNHDDERKIKTKGLTRQQAARSKRRAGKVTSLLDNIKNIRAFLTTGGSCSHNAGLRVDGDEINMMLSPTNRYQTPTSATGGTFDFPNTTKKHTDKDDPLLNAAKTYEYFSGLKQKDNRESSCGIDSEHTVSVDTSMQQQQEGKNSVGGTKDEWAGIGTTLNQGLLMCLNTASSAIDKINNRLSTKKKLPEEA
eukprot:CAMPEP_0114991080 /NCGR_PEP_ID=MMETSP0216-20121206/11161_1 /TAXON_ID=223996 /ORGANISM="Protocruzia adherens, Strain Boccale" /LENGTH=399 /DNA_ID=CAMNT_0002354343 /DNA_START=215 /DNA_END=1414 /DNA_ORIENTATION=+